MFAVHAILPSQRGPRRADGGGRALLVELLREALRDAGVMPGIAPTHPRRRALALAWLTGTFDDGVALPIGFVCDALGLDAGALAAAAQDALTAQLFPRGLPTTAFVVRGTATLAEQFLDSAALERLIPPLLEPAKPDQ